MTDATTAISPTNELSDDEVRKLLDWCREHAAEADALTTLNDMGPTLLRPSVGKDVIAVVNAILDELAKDAAPSAHVHAHMMILLATLIDHRAQRDAVDVILLRWMRHPTSFGPARATPPELQKDGFVQRIADALGWGSLSLEADKDAIARLLSWVDTWAPKQKAAAGRIVAMMRRNFPQGGELWKLVRVEFNRDKHGHGHRGERGERGDRGDRKDRRDRNNGRGPKPAGKPAEGAAAVEGAPAAEGEVLAEGAAAAEGVAVAATTADGAVADGAKKKRRRRRRKRKPTDGTTAAAGAAEGAEGASEGDDGDDGDDGAEGDGAESAAPAGDAPASGEPSAS